MLPRPMSRPLPRSSLPTWLDQQRLLLGFVPLNAAAGLTVGVAKVATSPDAVDLQATAAQLSLIAGTQSFGVLLMSLRDEHAQRAPQHMTGEQGGWRQLRAQLSLLRHDADLRSTGIVEFTGQAVNQYYSFFIIVIAIHQYRFSPADAAMLVSAQGGSYVFSLFALGGLMYRLGQVRFFRVSQVLAAAALLLGRGLGMQQTVSITRFALVGARAGRGRVSAVNAVFIGASNELGEFESGVTARWLGLVPSRVIGGLATLGVTVAWMGQFPVPTG